MKCIWNSTGVVLLGLTLVHGQTGASTTQFEFREPRRTAYRIETLRSVAAVPTPAKQWLRAWPSHGSSNSVEMGNRVVLQLRSTNALERLLQGRPLRLARQVTEHVVVLQAPDAWTAVEQAAELAQAPEVKVSCPVMRRHAGLHSLYAAQPNDPYYAYQWHLENR
ncbi:MAG: hypothetical protein KGS61_14775, partial [Verrucomicrobia bacterium]|nr:hypothetical protein [Verrucomicrobiota bacterium]